ncbi:D-glycero-beta-D-manno-heptose 1-phosphate adenylyltransferase [Allokutzneria sp. A3M-2-11 16]|uniref:D-glycero-beta-D-manno-heptose 1-phosphate adenylyltransferase n=1 Tax=Allokutzneria sp. A3M-2-11 16 TaxID=2962043 RepID=UPI0020B86328|nr:D-glycero-beta-D-manno-heptose 1-phosphate adenylyltransferase [Allokutzneria sp. A3M-2-11 16]MCP3804909.1 D-glycero-beta-D-manno-heptose 1-phosphate adenylyltransferase [Allokutzneria sp. A3M-2-11 16]
MSNPRALTPELPRSLAARRPRIAVIGDALLDGWMTGSCNRLCREAPAPVVDVSKEDFVPGGAANTAVNLAALGAESLMVTAVGDDIPGDRLVASLRSAGVRTEQVVRAPGRITTTKRRIIAGDQLMLRFDDGDRGPLAPDVSARLAYSVSCAVAGIDAVLVCDYGIGVLGSEVIEAIKAVRDSIPLLVVDAHSLSRWQELKPDVVTPNANEIATLLGAALPAEASGRLSVLERERGKLAKLTGSRAMMATLDRDGAVLFDGDEPPHRTWARPAPDNFTAGAGDTFVAALTIAAAAGVPLSTAAELAQAAADVVVHRPGTAVCSWAELAERLGSDQGALSEPRQLAKAVEEHRAAGRRIVFTNGCFDVLHRGHVAYLNQAKRLGDVLIVALNSDKGVRRLKGPERPVNTESDRAAVVAALSCVDHVVLFDDDTPAELLRALRPEVYAKGGDYTPDMLPETPIVRALGGEVHILDYLSDHSTTAVIDRIRTGSS